MSRTDLEVLKDMLATLARACGHRGYRLPVDPLAFALPVGVLPRDEWEPIARAALTSVFPCDARWLRGEVKP